MRRENALQARLMCKSSACVICRNVFLAAPADRVVGMGMWVWNCVQRVDMKMQHVSPLSFGVLPVIFVGQGGSVPLS